jgi:hypothetical protein
MTPMKTSKDGKQISKTLRVLVHSQKLPNTAPGKLHQQAVEKDMGSIFQLVAKDTIAI